MTGSSEAALFLFRQISIRVGCVANITGSSSNIIGDIQDNLLFFDEVFNEDDLDIDDPLADDPVDTPDVVD